MTTITTEQDTVEYVEIYDLLAQRTGEPIQHIMVSVGGAVIVTSVHGITTHYVSIDPAGYEYEPISEPVKLTQRTYGPPRKGRKGKIKKW